MTAISITTAVIQRDSAGRPGGCAATDRPRPLRGLALFPGGVHGQGHVCCALVHPPGRRPCSSLRDGLIRRGRTIPNAVAIAHKREQAMVGVGNLKGDLGGGMSHGVGWGRHLFSNAGWSLSRTPIPPRRLGPDTGTRGYLMQAAFHIQVGAGEQSKRRQRARARAQARARLHAGCSEYANAGHRQHLRDSAAELLLSGRQSARARARNDYENEDLGVSSSFFFLFSCQPSPFRLRWPRRTHPPAPGCICSPSTQVPKYLDTACHTPPRSLPPPGSLRKLTPAALVSTGA